VRHLAGTGWATADAMLMMQPRSSSVLGANGPSSGYCELIASATHASTMKVPLTLMFSVFWKSWLRVNGPTCYSSWRVATHRHRVLQFVGPLARRRYCRAVHAAGQAPLGNDL
jgi:hypothetical protein